MRDAETATRFQEVARAFADAFTTDNPRKVWSLRDGSPDWMIEAIHAAHGDMMPNDWVYEACAHAAELITEAESWDDVDQNDIAGPLVDIYTHDLMQWLASHATFREYASQAIAEHGDDTIEDAAQTGQFIFLAEIAQTLADAIDAQASEGE